MVYFYNEIIDKDKHSYKNYDINKIIKKIEKYFKNNNNNNNNNNIIIPKKYQNKKINLFLK